MTNLKSMGANITHLTNAQLELLDMFQHEVPHEIIEKMRDAIVQHLATQITKEMDDLFEEKGWGDDKLEEWATTHMRTPYKKA